MLFAKVVFSLAVLGSFDYLVPSELSRKIKVGSRVKVYFGNKKMIGYCVGLSRKTNIAKLKNILEVIDVFPLLGTEMLLLTKKLSDYYCCSWGQAIDTALPLALRNGKVLQGILDPAAKEAKLKTQTKLDKDVILIQELNKDCRWNLYLTQIRLALENQKSSIILLPDVYSALKAKESLSKDLGIDAGILYRKQPKELIEWSKIFSGATRVVIGIRSAIFAPVENLGLVIIESEEDPVYKQDQVPHYHVRDIAFMRTRIENAKLILGCATPSLEAYFLAKKSSIQYKKGTANDSGPDVKIIDLKDVSFEVRKKGLFSLSYLMDSITSNLDASGKTLLFLNRRGFATLASCLHCGTCLKCPRCSINLVYHFKENILSCHYCNFKMIPPNICPSCNSGYIRYSGVGTEKIESELHRIFPQARIKMVDGVNKIDPESADIFIASKSIIKLVDFKFDLTAVLSIDNSLNRIDFRSGEKAFNLLFSLLAITKNRFIIATTFPKHHVFGALKNSAPNIFYDAELKERKSLSFPPYRHLCLVKLRGKNQEKLKQVSLSLFESLKKANHNKDIDIISVNAAYPEKKRGVFYWQVLIKAVNPNQLCKFLKINLKKLHHSGIIVTVDMDPI